MSTTPTIKIDNVIAFLEQGRQDGEDLTKHITYGVFPFDRCSFVYFYEPDKEWREEHKDKLKFSPDANTLPSVLRARFEVSQTRVDDTFQVGGAGWHCQVKYFTDDIFIADIHYAIGGSGWLEKGNVSETLIKPPPEITADLLDFYHAEIFDEVQFVMFPVFVANSFMHCKNVNLIDEPLSRQQRRMRDRKGDVRYKVLDIEPFKEQVRREAQPGESHIQRALHICRGHFATYTDDKPLFGKVTGTFWKPMHVRGNSAAGVVIKDYEIKL